MVVSSASYAQADMNVPNHMHELNIASPSLNQSRSRERHELRPCLRLV